MLRRGGERTRGKEKQVQFSAFFPTAICYVIKIFQMHEHKVFVSFYTAKFHFTFKFTFCLWNRTEVVFLLKDFPLCNELNN